jgi:hypothetical protein
MKLILRICDNVRTLLYTFRPFIINVDFHAKILIDVRELKSILHVCFRSKFPYYTLALGDVEDVDGERRRCGSVLPLER